MPLVFDHGRSIGTTLDRVAARACRQVPGALSSRSIRIDQRLEQEAQIRALYDAVQASGHELLLEVIPPKNGPADRGRYGVSRR